MVGIARSPECGSIGLPQSKWGRHCCRPHSHRYVVTLWSEDRQANLASSVFPSVPSEDFPSGSVTGARTGIRFRLRFGPSHVLPKLPMFGFRCLPAPRPFGLVAVASNSQFPLRFAFLSFSRLSRPMVVQLSRSSQQPTSLWAGAFCNASLKDRADSNRHVSSGLKNNRNLIVRPVCYRLSLSVPKFQDCSERVSRASF